MAALERDFSALHVIELSSTVIAQARVLLIRYPLRAGDAVQLASALFLQRELEEAVSFAAFDERLNAAAAGEGLTVLS